MKRALMRPLAVASTSLGLMGGAASLSSQMPDSGSYGAFAASAETRTTVVSGAILLPVGAVHDPEGLGGTAWITGHALARRAGEVAGPGASVSVQVGRSQTIFTFMAVPSDWPVAWDRVQALLFDESPGQLDIEDVRTALESDLAFDVGSPVREFELEAARLVSTGSSAWARPVRGTPRSISRVTTIEVRSFRVRHYRREQATVSIVAPPGSLGPAPDGSPASIDPGPSDPAWSTPEHLEMERQITNAWIAVAWPVDPGLPRTDVEFLADLLAAALDPSPPDPDRFSVDVRLEEAPGGPVLLVEAAVFPEAADRWQARILGAPDVITQDGGDELFIWRKRRFRAARLMADSAPERRAGRIARDLDRDGVARNLDVETWALTRADLVRAARSLGPPRTLRLGPDLGTGGLMPS